MKLPNNRTLLVIAVVLIGAWLLMRGPGMKGGRLPWNQGQAGSIFQPGLHMGGGQ